MYNSSKAGSKGDNLTLARAMASLKKIKSKMNPCVVKSISFVFFFVFFFFLPVCSQYTMLIINILNHNCLNPCHAEPGNAFANGLDPDQLASKAK